MRWPREDHATDVTLASGPTGVPHRVAGLPVAWQARRWTRESIRNRIDLLWLIAFTIAGAYLVVFVARFPHNITEITWDGDYSAFFPLFETLASTGSAGHTVIASSGQWVVLWFGMLTASLPLHRELWSVAPTLSLLAAALMVGWSVAQLSIRRAAVLAVLIGLVASPPAWSYFMAMGTHNTTYACTALTGAYLIHLTRDHGLLLTLTAPLVVGIVVGTCLASDLLLGATAVIPLGLAAILAVAARDRRSRVAGGSALATVAVAVGVAKVTTAIMHSEGFLTVATPAKLAPSSELPERARLLFKGLESLFNATLGPSTPDSLRSSVGIASDVVMSAALLALLMSGIYATVRFARSSLLASSSLTPPQLARTLHIFFWVASAISACAAFWLEAETGGGRDVHASYYATVIFSVAAVIPLLLSSGSVARWLVPIFASVFFACGLIRLNGDFLDFGGVYGATAPAIEKAAVAAHVTNGYAGYGYAPSLTWHTDGRLTVRPVMECQNPGGVGLCPFYMANVPTWYIPQRRSTFLLVNSQELWVSQLPSGLGRPLAVHRFGAITMFLYPYDIASRLGPPLD